jgi:carboxymethylenebutenolidase
VADRLAAEGYVAVAPDLLSGAGPDGGGTDTFESSDAARDALYALSDERITGDLQALVEHVRALPGSDGTISIAGFCWGGSRTFQMATLSPDLAAAYVFYGSAPEDPAALARVRAPVYGFYGGDDERVNAGIPAAQEALAAAGVSYDPVIYEGAGHGFMERGEAADASEVNRAAMEAAWERWLGVMSSNR